MLVGSWYMFLLSLYYLLPKLIDIRGNQSRRIATFIDQHLDNSQFIEFLRRILTRTSSFLGERFPFGCDQPFLFPLAQLFFAKTEQLSGGTNGHRGICMGIVHALLNTFLHLLLLQKRFNILRWLYAHLCLQI